LNFNTGIGPLMTSFLDIWDTEYYFGRADLTFDLNVPQRVAHR